MFGIQQPTDHPQPWLQPVLPELPVGERHTYTVFAESGRMDVQSVQHLPGGRTSIPITLEFYDDKPLQRTLTPGGHIVET